MSARAKAAPAAARRRKPRGRGDELRAEIIAAAKDLLAASDSSAAVSIRAVADAVGVTSPSIYLHFADKDELIEAVCADVFAELDAAMLAAAEGVDDPMSRLCAYGLAYVQFAIEHPEHYRVATMECHAAAEASHLDDVLADSAFAHMVEAVTACMDTGAFTHDDPVPITLELWSAAHGVASLMITKPFLPWGDRLEFANRVLRSAALGHAVNDLNGGDMTPADTQAWIAGQREQRG